MLWQGKCWFRGHIRVRFRVYIYSRVVHGSLFLDPTRPGKMLTRPDPRLQTKSLTRPDPRPDPSPICIVFNWIIIYQLVKYRRKSINPNVVFEDSYRFRYQEIISKNYKIRSADPTRPDPPKSGKIVTRPDPTRPDPRVHPTRGQLCVNKDLGFKAKARDLEIKAKAKVQGLENQS